MYTVVPPLAFLSRRMPKAASKLARVVDALREQHGSVELPVPSNAFEHVLWEKVAYLATDEKRAAAFDALKRRVGLTPAAILAAKPKTLREVAESGGVVGVDERVKNMQDAAAFVVDEFNGSLDAVANLPKRDAMKVLQRIRGIGEPGAERILLLIRAYQSLPLDSNGARVLVRLGYGRDDKNYTKMYRSVRDATAPELVPTYEWLIDAHLLLRRHGQTVCKTTSPRCHSCAVRAQCAFGGRARAAEA